MTGVGHFHVGTTMVKRETNAARQQTKYLHNENKHWLGESP